MTRRVHPTLRPLLQVVDRFERETGQRPACLISQPDVRAAYVTLISGPKFSQIYIPAAPYESLRVSFRDIPWHIDLDCKPDTVFAMPAEYRPQ